MKNIIIDVDLAVKVIQVCVYANNKVQSNTEMAPEQFSAYLSILIPSKVVLESCSGSAIALMYFTLHDKGLICDPVGKAKSVALTEEGLKKSEEII